MSNHTRKLSTTIANNIQASAHAIAEAGQGAVTRSTNAVVQRVLHYDQLHEWMKVDSHIKDGVSYLFRSNIPLFIIFGGPTYKTHADSKIIKYRCQLNSFRDCFWSLFYVHNELVNIWSHLLPAFFYLVSTLGINYWTFHSDIKVPTADSSIFQVYVLCTVGCLLLSAIYHCTNSHSELVSRQFLKLDCKLSFPSSSCPISAALWTARLFIEVKCS